jgi:hypothetical protein
MFSNSYPALEIATASVRGETIGVIRILLAIVSSFAFTPLLSTSPQNGGGLKKMGGTENGLEPAHPLRQPGLYLFFVVRIL